MTRPLRSVTRHPRRYSGDDRTATTPSCWPAAPPGGSAARTSPACAWAAAPCSTGCWPPAPTPATTVVVGRAPAHRPRPCAGPARTRPAAARWPRSTPGCGTPPPAYVARALRRPAVPDGRDGTARCSTRLLTDGTGARRRACSPTPDGRDQPLVAAYRAEPLRRELALLAPSTAASTGLPLRLLTGRARPHPRPATPSRSFDCDTWDDIAAARARIREHGHVLDEWISAVKDELGIDLDVDTGVLLDLARDAAHGVARPAAPLTTFLVGYAAARAGGRPRGGGRGRPQGRRRWRRAGRTRPTDRRRRRRPAAEARGSRRTAGPTGRPADGLAPGRRAHASTSAARPRHGPTPGRRGRAHDRAGAVRHRWTAAPRSRRPTGGPRRPLTGRRRSPTTPRPGTGAAGRAPVRPRGPRAPTGHRPRADPGRRPLATRPATSPSAPYPAPRRAPVLRAARRRARPHPRRAPRPPSPTCPPSTPPRWTAGRSPGPAPGTAREARTGAGILAGHAPQPSRSPTARRSGSPPAPASRPDATAVLRSEHGADRRARGRLHATRGRRRPARTSARAARSAARGDQLLPAGALVTPAVLGLAAAAGYDTLTAVPRPRAEVLVLGDELLHRGLPARRPDPGRARPDARRPGCARSAPRSSPPRRLGDDAEALHKAIDGSDRRPRRHDRRHRARAPSTMSTPPCAASAPSCWWTASRCAPATPCCWPAPSDRTSTSSACPAIPSPPSPACSRSPSRCCVRSRGRPAPAPYTLPLADDGARAPARHPARPRRTCAATAAAVPLHYNGPAMLRGIAAADALAVVPPGGARPRQELELLDCPGPACMPAGARWHGDYGEMFHVKLPGQDAIARQADEHLVTHRVQLPAHGRSSARCGRSPSRLLMALLVLVATVLIVYARPRRLPRQRRRQRRPPRRRLLRDRHALHHRLRRHRPVQRRRPAHQHPAHHAAARAVPDHPGRHHPRSPHRTHPRGVAAEPLEVRLARPHRRRRLRHQGPLGGPDRSARRG